MPFKSQAQRALFWAKVDRNELPRSTAEEWEEHTPKEKKLPEHVKTKEAARAYGFHDELTKIGLTAWKGALRAGALGLDDVGRLTQHGVLDYGKEMSGLARGSENIAAQKGFTISRFNPRRLLRAGWDVLRGRSPEEGQAVAEELRNLAFGAGGGGGAAVAPLRTAFMAPQVSPLTRGSSPTGKAGLDALLTRHEVDELRTGLPRFERDLSPFPPTFIPGKRPETLLERINTPQFDVMRSLIDYAKKRVPTMRPHLREQIEPLLSGARTILGMPAARGTLPAGKHFDPRVILRESENVASLPPEVKERMLRFRKGEVQTLEPYGFTYGQSLPPDVQRRIMKAFEAGEI